jgi:hypothetical protein
MSEKPLSMSEPRTPSEKPFLMSELQLTSEKPKARSEPDPMSENHAFQANRLKSQKGGESKAKEGEWETEKLEQAKRLE